jgi:hypothetical protein
MALRNNEKESQALSRIHVSFGVLSRKPCRVTNDLCPFGVPRPHTRFHRDRYKVAILSIFLVKVLSVEGDLSY